MRCFMVLLTVLSALLVAPGVGVAAEPMTFSHFKALEPGSVHAEGWLGSYLQTTADAWPSLYAKERVPEVYGTYWNRLKTKSWWDGAPDYSANFADGIVRFAKLLPGSEVAKEVDPWVKQVLASQEPDGYLGAIDPPGRWNQWIDVFSQGVMMRALLYRYTYTGNKAVLDVCKRSAARIMKAFQQPASEVNHACFGNHSAYAIRAFRDLYVITGDKQYADFAKEIITYAGMQSSYTQALSNKNMDYMVQGFHHGVTESCYVAYPAVAYEVTGDETLLKGALAGWELMEPFVMVDGQPTGNEGINRKRPRAMGEHCIATEWAISNEDLLRIAGEVKFADAVERVVFNAYPGSKSPDTLCVGYMHSMNQTVASEWSHPDNYLMPGDDPDGGWSREYFTSATCPLCCAVVGAREMPYFVENMVMRSKDGLAVVLYGPAKVNTSVPAAGKVEMVMDTKYPFEDDVKITVNPEKPASFPIEIRIPGWCSSATLEINGKPVSTPVEPGKFALISNNWRKGDTMKLHMEVPIKLDTYPESPVRVEGTAVMRGPLTFVMPVAEDWREFTPPALGPGKTPKSYQVFAKEGVPWNYALIADKTNPGKSFTLKRFPENEKSIPWSKPVIGLEVDARQVLNWEAEGTKEHPMTPGLPLKPMKLSEKVTKVTLIPFGCARLRMSYLPTVKE